MRWPGPSKYYYRGHYRMGNQEGFRGCFRGSNHGRNREGFRD